MSITAWKVQDNVLADIETTGWPEPELSGQLAFMSTSNRLQYYRGRWYLRVVVLYQTAAGKRITICERFTADDDYFYLVDCDGQYHHLAAADDSDSCRLALTEFFTQIVL